MLYEVITFEKSLFGQDETETTDDSATEQTEASQATGAVGTLQLRQRQSLSVELTTKDGDKVTVITSYSIHYTKLYDGREPPRHRSWPAGGLGARHRAATDPAGGRPPRRWRGRRVPSSCG